MISSIIRLLFGKKFLGWLAPSFQGSHNTSSSRRVTAFIIMFLFACGHGIYFYKVIQQCGIGSSTQVTETALQYLLYLLIADIVFVLLLFGIVTAQHMIAFSKTKTAEDLMKKKTDESTTEV